MAKYLLDTNVLIGVFKGEAQLRQFVEEIDATIDATVYIELIQGAKSRSDVAKIEKAISQYRIIHFKEGTSKRAIELIRRYSKSHGLLISDAIIAATCLENNLILVTFNIRDFRFIKGLIIEVPQL